MNLNDKFEGQINSALSLPELANVLQTLLNGNYGVWIDGRLMQIKVVVDRVARFRIEIRHNEHPPPHFHITCNDCDVSYSIIDGTLLNGNPRHDHNDLIKWWYDRSRSKLIEIWNKTRPTNCPVGPINIQ